MRDSVCHHLSAKERLLMEAATFDHMEQQQRATGNGPFMTLKLEQALI